MARLERIHSVLVFFLGYGLVILGFVITQIVSTAQLSPFLTVATIYFALAFIFTLIKVLIKRSLDLNHLDYLVFEFLTAGAFLILLFTY